MKAQGKISLILASFAYMILGAVGIVLTLTMLLNGGMRLLLEGGIHYIPMFAAFLIIIKGLFEIGIALFGFQHCEDINRAKDCKKWGMFMIILSIISIIPSLLQHSIHYTYVALEIFIALVYMAGGYQNAQVMEREEEKKEEVTV